MLTRACWISGAAPLRDTVPAVGAAATDQADDMGVLPVEEEADGPQGTDADDRGDGLPHEVADDLA